MIKKLLIIGLSITLGNCLLIAKNSISGSRATIDSPLSDADIDKITSSKYWPDSISLTLSKADDDTFATLEKIPELQILHISRDANVSSLAPLSKLTQLRTLSLRNLEAAKNAPIDATPISSCTKLELLTIYATPVTQLDALSSCKNLKHVSLYMSEADSLEFLRSTPMVTELDLYGRNQKFPSYEPVASLKNLIDLSIYMNPQATDENLACLDALSQLEEIQIGNCSALTSLNFLRNCTEMERLKASGCRKLTNITAIGNMPFLYEVDLNSCPIRDISSLHNKTYLEKLNLSEAQITDLSPLASSIYMQRLELEEIKFKSLSPLAKMQRLEYLNLRESHVDLSTLPRLRKLEGIRLNNTAATDLEPLKQLPRLEYVYLNDTPATDLSPLAELSHLKTINVSKSFPQDQIKAFTALRPGVTIKQ